MAVFTVAGAVWRTLSCVCGFWGVAPCAWRVFTVAGARMLCVCAWSCVAGVREKKGGPVAGPPSCGVQAAVSYSPTPWRVQYHRRWQS